MLEEEESEEEKEEEEEFEDVADNWGLNFKKPKVILFF